MSRLRTATRHAAPRSRLRRCSYHDERDGKVLLLFAIFTRCALCLLRRDRVFYGAMRRAIRLFARSVAMMSSDVDTIDLTLFATI